MLSRVAENLYWLGRYIERAENTARLVNVNGHLLLDLPKGTATGWQPLITITGSEETFLAQFDNFDERSVVRFLVAEPRNMGSINTSLMAARENARTMRDIIPREAWERINELVLFAREQSASGVSKRGRHAYLSHIITGSQTIAGVLAGVMNSGPGYDFLLIGRNLERADMTTRIIDVRSASLIPDEPSTLRPFETIQWMSVLKSLTAYQMYRITMQSRVRRADVLTFLLQDNNFPRSVYRCIQDAERAMNELPRNEAPLRTLGRLARLVSGVEPGKLSQAALHEHLDQLQVELGQVHESVAQTYFLAQPTPAVDAANLGDSPPLFAEAKATA